MSLTPTQLQELQTIVLDLGEEFPHNADGLWDAAIRLQKGDLGPTSGSGGQVAFDAAVADIKVCQEEVQTYQQRQGSPSSGFDVAILQVVPATSTFPTGNVGEILYLVTAPNSYVATDQIVIDPVGPNSVQMDEVGTTVFRTVPAASGGVEINNLSTGAGFERVLTTADLVPASGQVNSVVGGVNISVNAADPVNPIVNLDAAITGVSVNAVTLSAAGAATNYLDETGAYSVPPSTVPDPLTLGRVILTNTNDPDLVDTTVALNVGAVDPDASQHIEIGNSDIQSKGSNTTTGQLNLNAVGGNIFIGAQTGAGNVRIFNNGEDVFQTIAQGIQVLGAETNDPSTGGTQRTFINLQNNIGALTTFLGHGIAATTDCILRNAVRSGLMTIEGVDSGNANTPLFRGDPDGQAEMFNDGVSVARSLGAAAGGLEANNTLTGAGFERVLTTSDAGGVVTQIEDGAGNIAVIGQGLGVIGVRSVGNTDAEERDLEWQYQDGTTRASIGNEFFTDLIFRNHITGRNMIFNCGTGGASRIRLHLDGTSATGGASLYAGTSAVPRLQSLIHGVEIGNGTLFLVEQAAQEANIAGQGQLWVDSADDSLKYVTEAGVVFDLTAGLTQPITLTADIDGDGFNLDDMGVMFMREQAAADADVAGAGQLWVLDEGFSVSLMFTNDNGNDFELAALNLTDMNTASLLVTGTGFVESLVFQPDVNRDYIVTATFELQSPAADDMNVELVIDTNAVFKGVLTYASQDGTITGTFALESQVGDVITNIVTVPTSGNATPDGTYVTITGALNMGATSGTHSVRVAKNADTGADGLFVAFAALQASVLQVS